ncbi:polysaccharide deacetylase family protein [Desulfovibrio sp. OttesenSCG-928-C06]|nr:polysaccharide deacetylase family protein [Desulfovibrio sp. OttesenSCG-928-C06]
MMSASLKSLPVLMHHYISRFPNNIAVTPEVFEEQCRILAENGWFGAGLAEAEDFLLGRAPLPPKRFLLTFDDGYLDNWVYALPIMRKYGHKGVVFVTADRLSGKVGFGRTDGGAPASGLRPSLQDVWDGRCAADDLPGVDTPMRGRKSGYEVKEDLFLSWDEARAMDKEGVLSIAAHSMRHERVLTGGEWSDFARPGHTLSTFWHIWPEAFWGLPDFPRKPELANRAFILHAELVEEIKRLVPQDEAEACEFFADGRNTQALRALLEKWQNKTSGTGEPATTDGSFGTDNLSGAANPGRSSNHGGADSLSGLGRFETRDEMRSRVGADLKACQETLTRELGHPVRSFCWPWGKWSDDALELGRAAGFEIFYTCEMGPNKPGSAAAVNRFKVRNKGGNWLLSRLKLYASPLLGSLYAKFRI